MKFSQRFAKMCESIQLPVSPDLAASPSRAIPSGISVHSVETHSVVISEAFDFEVTLHFSVGTHRDSNEPHLHVALMNGFRCDLAPLTTSFGTVGQWERQHLAMAATCLEGEAWAASRNWNHRTHFLWDPRAAPTFHPPTTQRHRAQCSTFHVQLSNVVQSPGSDRARLVDVSTIQWYAVVRRLAAFSSFLIVCSSGTPTFRRKVLDRY